ncbi:DHH family phosphoesterase [Persicimonas caeni]|nr:bifunctional oligoribonuclease/PAP phosphatase NrnA [Persicimonas caeni]
MNASTGGDPAIELVPTTVELADQIERFLEVIEENERFLVVSHTSPDGDAIGSTLSMGLLLEALGKEVVFYNRDAVPYNFGFLEGADAMVTEVPADADIDVTVVLDCAEPERIGEEFPEQGWGDTIVVVDHHKTWDAEFADIYVRDVGAAATGELVYRLVVAAGVKLDKPIAEALYCCVMTDTGSFRYSNTSRTTFRIAGELIDAGVEPWRMTSHIYESNPKERLELLALVLNTLEFSHCGRLAFLRIEDEMFESTGTGPELTDGFINYARSIRGVEVATQLREDDEDLWRVSFRSRGKVDVSELAAKFGGGGHHNAAGCRIEGTSDEIVEKLSQALVELLDE